jgi:hypothetical protein
MRPAGSSRTAATRAAATAAASVGSPATGSPYRPGFIAPATLALFDFGAISSEIQETENRCAAVGYRAAAMQAAQPVPPPSGPPFAALVADVELQDDELPAEQVLEGDPRVRSRMLLTSADGAVETGVWEITPGVCSDVEADETFVVLTGAATVEIEDGPTLKLAPGVVGGFQAGARTVWRVSETLRKVYTVAAGD